jgi:hypothetical protein
MLFCSGYKDWNSYFYLYVEWPGIFYASDCVDATDLGLSLMPLCFQFLATALKTNYEDNFRPHKLAHFKRFIYLGNTFCTDGKMKFSLIRKTRTYVQIRAVWMIDSKVYALTLYEMPN